jgi:valyl-tRNA synthetase
VERLFQTFQYGQAGQLLYDFVWSDFADWYLEIAKQQLAQGGARAQRTAETLLRAFDLSLRLLHPFVPFVTEELWGHLRRAALTTTLAGLVADWPDVLMIAPWPEPRPEEGWEESAIEKFEKQKNIIRAIRNIRAEKDVKPSQRFSIMLESDKDYDLLQDDSNIIYTLSGTYPPPQSQIFRVLDSKPTDYITVVSGATNIYLPLSDLVDAEEERARLTKELADAEAQITRLERLLGSDFASKAPAAVVQKERDRLAAYKDTAEKIKAQM